MTVRLSPESVAFSVFFAILCSSPSAADVGMARQASPGPAAACFAWSEHIGALIDEHRVAHELDDEALWSAITQYGSARTACSLGDFTTGIRLYETISIGRVRAQLK